MVSIPQISRLKSNPQSIFNYAFPEFLYICLYPTPLKKGDDDSRHIPSKKETASRNRF